MAGGEQAKSLRANLFEVSDYRLHVCIPRPALLVSRSWSIRMSEGAYEPGPSSQCQHSRDHHRSQVLLLPVFDRGQLDTYRVSELQGTATFVES
jgi:hypothetical protein